MRELPTPTPRELDILKVLWSQGLCSVRDVHQQLLAQKPETDEPELAYNTVQTMLRIMEAKGLVRHQRYCRPPWRIFFYSAQFTRDESARRFLDDVFGGSVLLLVESLLQSEGVSAEELERMEAVIDETQRKQSRR